MSNPEKPKLAPVIHERPKMPARTWSALRSHIITERRKKQEKEGKMEEEERMKREREHRKKQEANNLEETKEQIAMLEEKLTNLKEEKHQLFLTLKKVLNEDDVRRRKETSEMAVMYPHQHPASGFPLTGHVAPSSNPTLGSRYMQPMSQVRQSVYMKPGGHALPAVPSPQHIKRQRTPSPTPPPASIHQPYYQATHLTTTQARVVSSVFGAPSPSYSMSGGSYNFSTATTQSGVVGGRDLLREAVNHGLGPIPLPARDLLQSIGAREREILGSLGPRERELLAGMSSVGAGSQSRDILPQTGGGREEEAYARYLLSFQQQLDPALPKTSVGEVERAKAMTMVGETDRSRMSLALSQAQPLVRGGGGGYYTPASKGPAPAYPGSR